MNRQEKINALRRVIDGEPASKVFPAIEVFIVDDITEAHTLFMVGPKYRHIATEQVNGYLAKVKEDNPLSRLNITRMAKEEYDMYVEYLESQY